MLEFIFVVHCVWSFQVHEIHGRRRSKMARADMFCSQECENRLCAWQVREQLQVYGHEPRLDPHTKLVRVIIHHQVGRILPGPGACTACPSCLRVLCTCLRVPCLRLCFCQPACVDRYCVPARTCGACAGPLCANALHLFARAFSVPACVLCLHLVYILICSHDHWGGAPPLNHGRAASTLTTGAQQRLLWLILFSPLASVCTTETFTYPFTHTTPLHATYPFTHTTPLHATPHTHTQTRHVSTLDKIISKYSSQSHAHIHKRIP